MSDLEKIQWFRELINLILSPENHVYCKRIYNLGRYELVLNFGIKDKKMAAELKSIILGQDQQILV